MTIVSSPTKIYTPDEYLALEIEADTRHEYYHGAIVQMTGGTPAHNKINSALNALLWFALRRKPYNLFMTDQRLWIPECGIYAYPDAMIIGESLQLQPGRKDTVTNPILIAEVLSDSTKAYDRDEKFAAYRTIATFREYLLIDQYQPCLEQYVKQSTNQWLFTEYKGLDARVSLSAIPVEILLADLYESVEF
jgi:Uma2 family endonuclease